MAHGAGLADRRGAARLKPDPEPERAEQARRRLLGRARQVRRHLVGDAHPQGNVGIGAHARRDDREHRALHGLCRGQRLQGRAGRRLERGLGRRLVPQRRTLQLHEAVSRLRHQGDCRLRARERRTTDRPPRDLGQRRQLRAPDGRGVRPVRVAGRAAGEDRLRRRCRRHPPLRRERRGHQRVARRAVHGRAPPARARGGREAAHQHHRARAGQGHGAAPHLPELAVARGRARAGVQRLGLAGEPARARGDTAVHAHAGRADGLHAGHRRPDVRRHRRAAPRAEHDRQGTVAVRRAVQPGADGGRPARELRKAP